MSGPDVVPDRLTNPLNRHVIGIIVVIGLVLYFVFNSITDEELFPIVFGVSVILPGTVRSFTFQHQVLPFKIFYISKNLASSYSNNCSFRICYFII